MTEATNRPYKFWQDALNGNFGPVHDGNPQCGFYRKPNKHGEDAPTAIWEHDGQMVALVNGKQVDPDVIWTWVCKHPITKEVYDAVLETGAWPDSPAPMGHNTQTGDPHTDLMVEFEGEREFAEEFLKTPIDNQEKADKAAVWSKKLSQIAKKATDQHKVEKQPHLDAGRAIDDKWRSLKDEPKELSTRLKRHLDSWLREQARIEEERRKQVEAEAKRIAAEQATNAETADRLSEEAQQAESDAKEQNAAAGRTGARVSLRTFVSAEITDYEKLLEALKDRREVKELVQSLANRAAKSGVDLPGMKIIEEKRAA